MDEPVTLQQVEALAERLPLEQQWTLADHLRQRLNSAQNVEPSPHDGALADLPAANPPASVHQPSRVDLDALRQEFAKLKAQLCIRNLQPSGARKLQERMLEDGVKPEDRLLSQGIIEMRNE